MKKTQKILGAALAMVIFTTNANAQATATADAAATIIAPISIVKNADLNFGNIAVNALGGTVILDPSAASTRSIGGAGGVSFPANTGTVTSAVFTVSGEAGFTFDMAVITPSVTLSNGTDNMVANNFTVSNPTGTLDGTGNQTVYVGADLDVNGSQAPGLYTSTSSFTVLVNYN
ncbi:MAG: DUF4402 domain-containing protein [Chitinophagaceae bacterium]|nr:DUF4402 domain-containing protein [Chitinophagaceae bacterium]